MNKRTINYNPPTKQGLSPKQLEKLLQKWQKKLNMQDWKINLKIVDFQNSSGFRQSGHFENYNQKQKTCDLLLTWNPFRNDEEHTLLHELVHIFVFGFDNFAERLILKNYKEGSKTHDEYLEKLEELVEKMTVVFLGREEHDKEKNQKVATKSM